MRNPLKPVIEKYGEEMKEMGGQNKMSIRTLHTLFVYECCQRGK